MQDDSTVEYYLTRGVPNLVEGQEGCTSFVSALERAGFSADFFEPFGEVGFDPPMGTYKTLPVLQQVMRTGIAAVFPGRRALPPNASDVRAFRHGMLRFCSTSDLFYRQAP